jgi:hypothetical protein
MQQYLMGREVAEPVSETQWQNAAQLLFRVCNLLVEVPKELILSDTNIVSSGYRPPLMNKKVGGSPNSAHLVCQAVDIKDPNGQLAAYLAANQPLLVKHQLWMEDPAATKTWCHLDTRVRNNRVFKP